jgi:hypothetical protein
MSDKEDAAASLGDSEVSSVQYPPADSHPEVGQVPEDGGEVPAAVDGEKARDVLAKEPLGARLVQQAHDVCPQS